METLLSYTIEHQKITISLATIVVGVLAYEKLRPSLDLGSTARWLFYAAVGLFAVSGLAGGVFAAKLAEMSNGSYAVVKSVNAFCTPLEVWRSVQHVALWLALASAALGGILTKRAAQDSS